MNAKRKRSGRISSSTDEAPQLTARWVAEADLRKGDKFIRRGRPKLADPKRLLSIRVATSVIAAWKASGAGWQTRMAEVLAKRTPKAKARGG
jgi:uncharacterized protein (DUF4415 family)